ncbi:uncharacterized protein [Antedon mediterranea]|uniref:uncharacterized protein n=1 Tax=Antedon mediterranea TaxID=105859 RepID=UPI003AF53DF4
MDLYLVFFASVSFVGCLSQSVENPTSVLILGAGATGLQAAQTLIDNGVENFLILEGADYIGGRVHDVEFAGVQVEQGANWAQPSKGKIEDLVKELQMETHLTNWYSFVAYNSTGHNITDEATQVFNVMEEKLRKAFDIAEDLWDLGDTDMSIRSGLRTVGWLPKTPLEHTIEWSYTDYELADIPELSSLKFHSTEVDEFIKRAAGSTDEDKPVFVKDPRGYKYIFNATLDFLADKTNSNKILLNKVVTTVDQTSPDHVIVTCSDGTQYQATNVIVTFSLAVLQNQVVTFKPDLPGWKMRTLNRIEMASYSKIYVQFPKNFWGDREIIMRTSDQRGKYPFFINLEAEGLYPEGTNALLVEATGDESKRIEAQPDEVTKAEIEEMFRGIFGEENVPNITNMFISGWTRNPLTLGAYSLWTPNLEEECAIKMQSRVDRLFFGGEHTSENSGFVIGAMESGEREALKVVECQAGKDCPQWEAEQSCYCGTNAVAKSSANIFVISLLVLFVSCIKTN